jgi:uncharacterized protein YjbI with pentapeptide repeats
LSIADLTNANLFFSDLKEAKVDGIILGKTYFTCGTLNNANFSDKINVQDIRLDDSVIDEVSSCK